MLGRKDKSGLHYTEKAFFAFHELMANRHKNMIDNVNRTNKGELFVLQFLTMHDREALPSELSVALQASTARVSALLGTLEKKGQIVRSVDESNRRNILVSITEAGRARAQSEIEGLKSAMLQAFADMGEMDTAEFLRLTGLFFGLMQKYMTQSE